MGRKVYQYWNSRETEGIVKTLTIKRTRLGELFMFVTVEQSTEQESASATGKTAGFDFGLKTFLVCSEGFNIEAPLFFKQGLKAIQKASRELSRKQKGSANWERARLNLVRQNDRDDNAAKNIKAVGALTAAPEGDVRRAQPAVAV